MRSDSKIIIKYVLLSAFFLIGISLGLLSWNRITLPFENPWGITGTLTEIRYNPTNDTVRFIVFLLFPVVTLLTGYFLLNTRKINDICFKEFLRNPYRSLSDNLPSAGKKIFMVILLLLTVIVSINLPNYLATRTYEFDPFHEGDTLGSGVTYMAGKIPYKDYITLHGIFEDSLRSVVAFSLFGRSIGSVRTLESSLKIVSFLLLSVFLIQIYHRNYLYSITTFLILMYLYKHQFGVPRMLFIKTMDITVFSFLITLPFLQGVISRIQDNIKETRGDAKKLFIVNFLFSFIPLASFCYSVDRGFFLFATYLIVSPALYFLFFRRSVFRIHYLTSSLLALLSAILLMGFLLHWNFLEFFKYTFLIMPKYRDLMGGFVYPIDKIYFLTVCVVIAANTYWVAFKFIQEFHLSNRKLKISLSLFLEKYFVEFCLVLLSIFFFKSALGRSDWVHVAYNIYPAYILSIYILTKHYLHNILRSRYTLNRILTYCLSFIIILISILGIYRSYSQNLITRNFPLNVPDSEFIQDKYKAAISFLKNNLNDDEGFFTFTNEASWYYFIDKPSPTLFPIVVVSMPYFYQEAVIEDLKNSNVKFILYRNDDSIKSVTGYVFDGFSNELRLPIILDYIKENYVFHKKIDDNEIWIRKIDNQGL